MAKIIIGYRGYRRMHESKDPGLIALGLQSLGWDVTMLTTPKNELNGSQTPFALLSEEFSKWLQAIINMKPDCTLIYHALGRDFTPLLQGLNRATIPVIIKADSDGTLSPYPYLKAFANRYCRQSLRDALKTVAKVFMPWWADQWLLNNLRQSDGMIVESPMAKERTMTVLAMTTRENFTSKIHVCPLPVSPLYTESTVAIPRRNQIISIGRWNDMAPKNPRLLLKTVSDVLEVRGDFKAVIVGPGESLMKRWVSSLAPHIKSRISILGPLSPTEIKLHLNHSKIFFSSSRWESFGLAAAEALCSGCTLVGPDLPPFRYLIAEGRTGTLAKDYSKSALYRALGEEIDLWDQGIRDPKMIATQWQHILDYRLVAHDVLEAVNTCAR